MKKILLLTLIFSLIFILTSCKPHDNNGTLEFDYPDFELTPDGTVESWDYGDKDDLTIEWYVDSSSWMYDGVVQNDLTKYIYDKTGIKIKWSKPVTDDGVQLNSLITGNMLPDVVTISASTNQYQNLAIKGYVYPLNELANRWAPEMFEHIDSEITSYYGIGGNMYGIPNLYYTDNNLQEVEDQGTFLGTNGGIFARKDYLDWYLKAYPDADPTTPAGFIEMCEKVKTNYGIRNSESTVQLTPFDNNTNQSIRWLAQYFAAPLEDSNGNLTYLEATPQYEEALVFLNTLYRKHLISDANFTDNSKTVSTNLQNGKPFIFMGTPQVYQTALRLAYTQKGIEYVPIVFTNSNGDAPLLQDLSGVGSKITMISTNCAHPERVIRLFDYLTSLEGQQRVLIGEEDTYYEYTVEPGSTVDGKTYKYGLIKWSSELVTSFANYDFDKYGLFNMNLLNINRCMLILQEGGGDSHTTLTDYIVYNMKAPLYPYSGSFKDMNYMIDATDSRYKSILTKENNCSKLWIEKLAEIIQQESEEDCKAKYKQVLNRAKKYGYEEVLAFNNEYFLKSKQAKGIEFAYPKNQTGYVSPEINFLGDQSVKLEIPKELIVD